MPLSNSFFSTNLVKSRKTYNKLGQLDYKREEDTEDIKELKGKKFGRQWIYIGQFKKETEIEDGIGIKVNDFGGIYEGYWKDGKQNGYCRFIWPNGNYYIGDFKDGAIHGNGEYHYSYGEVYSGQFENNKRNGHGTYTLPDGTKLAGEWKDGKFLG